MTKSIDVRTPGIQAIAKKWKLSVSEVMRLVNDGAKVEKEHTKSLAKARQVARDHIAERPDYYKKLHKMEKSPISMKEETGISGIRGLGNVTGDPALDPVNQYVNTNTMSYEDYNGAVLKMIRDRHNKHATLGFTSYDPTDKHQSNKPLQESDESTKALVRTVAKKKLKDIQGKKKSQALRDKLTRKMNLKELGDFDKTGSAGSEGLSDAPPKSNVKEGWASIGHAYDWAGDRNSKAKFYGKKPKATTTKGDEKDDTYKDSKQGGKVKFAKTVKEAMAATAAQPVPASYQAAQQQQVKTIRPGQTKINVRDLAPKSERSGRGTARLSQGGQSGSGYNTLKPTSTDVKRNISNRFNPSFGQQGASGKVSSVKGTTSFSQGGSNIGAKMAKSSPSQMVSKMSDAGRQAAAAVTKVAPTASRVAGIAARALGGPAATAAAAVMSPTPAGEKTSEFQRQANVAKGVSYKSQGRSVDQYEKDVLTPKASETPKAPNPKVDAPTPPSRPDYFSRGQAFSAARKEAGGGEGKFSYQGGSDSTPKTYQTNVTGEKYKQASQLKQTSVQEMDTSGMRPSTNIDDRRGVVDTIKGAYAASKKQYDKMGMTGSQATGGAVIDAAKSVASTAAKNMRDFMTHGSNTNAAALDKSEPKAKLPKDATDDIIIPPAQKLPGNGKLNELRAETLGSYIKKASSSRKEALNKGGAKADVTTWAKRQKGITTAIKKLTNEETNMENKDLINEALENILEENLSEMKENLKQALQEKAMEKLEERKKEIAANYFAQ